MYNGFQNIPELLRKGNGNLTLQWFDVGVNGNPIQRVTGQYAKYVLVLDATEQITPADTSILRIDDLNYAYINTTDHLEQTGNKYYTFQNVVINGVAGQTLTVTEEAGKNITESGLYMFANNTNGQGYSTVYRMDGVNTAGSNAYTGRHTVTLKDPLKTIDMGIANNQYSYADGVLTDKEHGTYYTVVNGATVYLINPTKGTSTPVTLGALSAGQYGATSNIWFELNEYGCIDLIYIIDGGLNANDPGGAGGSAASRYPTPVVDPRYESIYDAAGIDVTVGSNGTDIDVTVNKEAFQKWMQTATAEAKADIYGVGYGYVAGIAFPVPEGVTYTNGYYKWQRNGGAATQFAATDYDSVNKNINLFVYFTNTSGNFMSGGDWTFVVD